jgi:hypothetical protein
LLAPPDARRWAEVEIKALFKCLFSTLLTKNSGEIMLLLTKEILKKLPPIYTNCEKENNQIKVIVKFFLPGSGASWYATEYDPVEKLFFGFANLGDDEMAELGYFSLKELKSIRHPSISSLKVERDKFWNSNTSLDDVINFRKR